MYCFMDWTNAYLNAPIGSGAYIDGYPTRRTAHMFNLPYMPFGGHHHCHNSSFDTLMKFGLFSSMLNNFTNNLMSLRRPASYYPVSYQTYPAYQPFQEYQTYNSPANIWGYYPSAGTSFLNYTTNNTVSALDTFNQTYNNYMPSTQQNPFAFKSSSVAAYSPASAQRNTTAASQSLLSAGYNAQKGNDLASTALRNSHGFSGYCARYVKRAIEQCGLGRYEYGDAYNCADILSRNPNFKEISANNLNLSRLPAGCILVYGQGVAGYSSKYGHVEITDGRGHAVSDGITNNIRSGARVFIPV